MPAEDAQGYATLIEELEGWLAELTGYAEVSIQPNAGSQGELAGLLAIRGYHRARDEQTAVCLIPSSAHGTNAASAVMAGMKVVVVKATEDGSVDLDDLKAKVETHHDRLAGIMVTYPSTHGVFEEGITDLCALVHDAGGQVYVDGANLNALVGLARPGRFGADVSHLNLHKTFCIPHGGGGPGVGPVGGRGAPGAVPADSPCGGRSTVRAPGIGPVSAAPYGSAGILPISWAYIAMMGADGLRRRPSTRCWRRTTSRPGSASTIPVLYTGRNGRVAHECILDLRPLTKASGITVDDVAKRLIDYGFHAPTMSFPVPGTLMVEPTESENLAELDRFCDGDDRHPWRDRRCRVRRVAGRGQPAGQRPAHSDTGDRRRVDPPVLTSGRRLPGGGACRTARGDGFDKYWPPVGRIDGAYGDRNLVCICPPPEAFEKLARDRARAGRLRSAVDAGSLIRWASARSASVSPPSEWVTAPA